MKITKVDLSNAVFGGLSQLEKAGFSKGQPQARLEAMIDRLNSLVNQVNQSFEEIDRRFGEIGRRFGEIDRRSGEVDKRFDAIDRRFEEIEKEISALARNFWTSNAVMVAGFLSAVAAVLK